MLKSKIPSTFHLKAQNRQRKIAKCTLHMLGKDIEIHGLMFKLFLGRILWKCIEEGEKEEAVKIGLISQSN
jgi:hypothetical protein